jgi:hypothetical protein
MWSNRLNKTETRLNGTEWNHYINITGHVWAKTKENAELNVKNTMN